MNSLQSAIKFCCWWHRTTKSFQFALNYQWNKPSKTMTEEVELKWIEFNCKQPWLAPIPTHFAFNSLDSFWKFIPKGSLQGAWGRAESSFISTNSLDDEALLIISVWKRVFEGRPWRPLMACYFSLTLNLFCCRSFFRREKSKSKSPQWKGKSIGRRW